MKSRKYFTATISAINLNKVAGKSKWRAPRNETTARPVPKPGLIYAGKNVFRFVENAQLRQEVRLTNQKAENFRWQVDKSENQFRSAAMTDKVPFIGGKQFLTSMNDEMACLS